MKKEDWNKIEKELFYGYRESVLLMIDGYKVRLTLGKIKMKLMIFVDVKDINLFDILGKKEEDLSILQREVREKFFFQRKKNSINVSAVKKSRLSRKNKEFIISKNKVFTYYEPFFSSFRTLKSKFNKTCKSIEMIKDD